MNNGRLQQLVVSAIARATNQPEDSITPQMRLEELGLDSLGIASIISEIEGAYDVQLSPDTLMEFLAVQNVGEFVEAASAMEGTLHGRS
jgi:acyl carrier protein